MTFFKPILTILKYFFIIIPLLYVSSAYSQTNPVNFHELDIHGVLFNKKVNILFEDSSGYLWIGSNSGLDKYDGHNLVQYQLDVFNPNSLPNNNINSIIEDEYQNLWIGSESYLIHFNRKENKFTGFLKNVTSVVKNKSKNGFIWVNLKGVGLLKIKINEDITKLNLASEFSNLPNNSLFRTTKEISVLVEDDFKRQWAGTNQGIQILDSNGSLVATNFTERIVDMKLFENNKILAITPQNLYVLGYNKSDNNLEVLENYSQLLNTFNVAGNLTTTAINPENNNLWVGTSNGMIKATRNNNKYTFNHYNKNNHNVHLLNNQITSTIYDSYGNLWIGSFKGINKYLGRTSLFEYTQITTNNNLTSSLNVQDTNSILVGTNAGLYNFNPLTKTHSKIENNIKEVNIITTTYEKTELLIADNLSIYQSINYKPNSSSLNLVKLKSYKNHIKHIASTNKNEIWVALWSGGIDVWNRNKSISDFKKKIIEKLKNHHTSALLLTSEDKLWIGTRGEGLYLIDLVKERYKHYLPTKENGLTSNAILSLHEDKNGNVWIGTRGGGLNLYQKNSDTFKNFKESKANSPKIVSAIEEDYNGNIWMSTRDGLTVYNINTQRFTPFGVEDGINENQFVFNSSASNPQKDILYFGCSDGFYSVYPKKLIPQTIVPTTVITSFSTFGENDDSKSDSTLNRMNEININSAKEITLPYSQNNIYVNFSSLDLTAPNKNEYAYKLEGLHNYWVYTSAFNRNANYNDLANGTYTFMVKSSNSDGVWNEEPTKVTFTIQPPIWKSTWAIIIYIILGLLIIYISSILIRRWYVLKKNLLKETISREKDNEHNRMKMVFFTDISHELRTPLSLILGTIEKVIKEKNFTLSPVSSERIYNNTLRMHRLINQIMDIRKFDEGKLKLNISKNNVVEDVHTIKNAFNDFANNNDIKYEFISAEDEILGWYDVDILEKTLFNLLSNAFKYTKEKGAITVTLEQVKLNNTLIGNKNLIGKHIKCTVKDNGIGIPKKDLQYIFDRYYQATKAQRNQIPGTGIGMELVHKLIDRHHGAITVESEENVFTEFTFYLPISKGKYNKNERIDTGMPLKRNFIKASEFQVIDKTPGDIKPLQAIVKSNKAKILIVEDNIDLRQMIKDELNSDFTIIEASNGKEGYETALTEKPDLIISDIMMPVQDGISMLKQIKKNEEFNNIPIFMLTAKNSNDTKIECLSLGANDYIEKPFSLDFLKWKLKNTFKTRENLKEKYSKVITTAPVDIQVDSNDEILIKKLIKIIEENMNNNILTVEFLASEIGMSRANLYRKVQLILNDTPINFIKTIKLKRAAQLLKQNKMYISEVAYMTGFNNQKYFSKCFNKEYGMSPTEYINNHKAPKQEVELEQL
ncbi:two-component regulator propeller domain-containing protein [Mariniflexile sp.]|uniref:hybrid sensor histidine kinase/response regulator transcription factor n=1 Tax=Mariniflexile sp. TaxID=1979402 RepID=UPI003568721C